MQPLVPVFIIVFIFYGLVELITSRKRNHMSSENQDTSNDTNQRSLQVESTIKTSAYFKVIAEHLNKDGAAYFVDRYGNRIILDLTIEEKEIRILIQMDPDHYMIFYRVEILRDFPDERLHKLSELIVRLNNLFFESKFSMFMESRSIYFDSTFNTKLDHLTYEAHFNITRWLIDTFQKHQELFNRVAFNDEEPIAVMMDLPQ